jgi:chromosome segregation ATPase
LETEKVKFEMALTECQKQFEASQSRLKEAQVKLVELHTELALANELKQAADQEVQATQKKQEIAESQLIVIEAEVKNLLWKVGSLEKEVEKERALSAESFAKYQKLEDELLRMKGKAEFCREAELQRVNGELKITQVSLLRQI